MLSDVAKIEPKHATGRTMILHRKLKIRLNNDK